MAQAERAGLDETLEGLRLLADETRWRLIQALRDGDHLVGELVDQTGLPQNLVSYHLGILRQAGLVRLHKSDADGRATYYGVDLAPLTALYRRLGTDLALPITARPEALPALTSEISPQTCSRITRLSRPPSHYLTAHRRAPSRGRHGRSAAR